MTTQQQQGVISRGVFTGWLGSVTNRATLLQKQLTLLSVQVLAASLLGSCVAEWLAHLPVLAHVIEWVEPPAARSTCILQVTTVSCRGGLSPVAH